MHDDIMTWKWFLHCWPFVRGIHQSLVDSPHKGLVMQCFDFFLCKSCKQAVEWPVKMSIICEAMMLMWSYHIDGLMQERRNSIANALELRLSCINPKRAGTELSCFNKVKIIAADVQHQQPWYWLCRMGRSMSYLRKDFNHLCHIKVKEWHKM